VPSKQISKLALAVYIYMGRTCTALRSILCLPVSRTHPSLAVAITLDDDLAVLKQGTS
jgi:hypothetical protein